MKSYLWDATLDDAARRVRLEPLVGHETTVTLGFEPDRALRSKDGVRPPLSEVRTTIAIRRALRFC